MLTLNVFDVRKRETAHCFFAELPVNGVTGTRLLPYRQKYSNAPVSCFA
jgi:hypothetical protein